MAVENNIATNSGRENHFRVPDGYFASIEKQVMDGLPDCNKPLQDGKVKRLRLWRRIGGYAAAACFAGLLAGYMLHHKADPDAATQADDAGIAVADDEYYMDMAVDDIMMDDDDLYSYIANE